MLAYIMNNTKHRELKNVIYLVNILNISDSLSPSCITGVDKQFKIKMGLNVCKEKIKDLQKDSPCHADIIAVVTQQNRLNGKLLYDVSGSFLPVVRTTSCAEEPLSGCQQTQTPLMFLLSGFDVDNKYLFRNSFYAAVFLVQTMSCLNGQGDQYIILTL